MAAHQMIIGSRDWRYQGWAGSFYPDDLPDEWRLGYYANEFMGVLVPAALWRSAGREEWEEWRQDVPAGFRFFLECAESGSDHRLERCRQLLGPHYGGRLAPEEALVTEAECADLRLLRQRLEALSAAASPGRTPALFVAGEPPQIECLRAVRLLAELAGLS